MVVLSDGVLGAIVGGIIGFVSGVVTNLIKDYTARPILSIIPEKTIEWSYDLYSKYMDGLGYKDLNSEERYWTTLKIAVTNRGKTAAEDCKASFVSFHFAGSPAPYTARVGWMSPRDDSTVTINPGDVETIDLCAFNSRFGLVFTSKDGYGENPQDGFDRLRFNAGEGAIEYEKTALEHGIKGRLQVSASNAKECAKNIQIYPTSDHRGLGVSYE